MAQRPRLQIHRFFLVAILLGVMAVSGLMMWSRIAEKTTVHDEFRESATDVPTVIVDAGNHRPQTTSNKTLTAVFSEPSITEIVTKHSGIDEFLANSMLEPTSSPDVVDLSWQVIRDARQTPVNRNNAANLLTRHPGTREPLARLLLESVVEKTTEDIWREYALQHLANLHQEGIQQAAIRQELTKWITHIDKPIAGTALLQLATITGPRTSPDHDSISDLAGNIAENEQAHVSNRITAVAIIGNRKAKEKVALIRSLLSHPTFTIRRVAVAALGQIGDTTDLDHVARLEQDPHKLVIWAAKSARLNLTNKSRAPHD